MEKRNSRLWSEVIRFTPIALFLVVVMYLGGQVYFARMGANLLDANSTLSEKASAATVHDEANVHQAEPVVEDGTVDDHGALAAVMKLIDVADASELDSFRVTYDALHDEYLVRVRTATMKVEATVSGTSGAVLYMDKSEG